MDSVELGGRDVDERGTNAGLIRCPRCMSRILSKCGTLTARDGDEQVLTLTPLLWFRNVLPHWVLRRCGMQASRLYIACSEDVALRMGAIKAWCVCAAQYCQLTILYSKFTINSLHRHIYTSKGFLNTVKAERSSRTWRRTNGRTWRRWCGRSRRIHYT